MDAPKGRPRVTACRRFRRERGTSTGGAQPRASASERSSFPWAASWVVTPGYQGRSPWLEEVGMNGEGPGGGRMGPARGLLEPRISRTPVITRSRHPPHPMVNTVPRSDGQPSGWSSCGPADATPEPGRRRIRYPVAGSRDV
jgi:hypothetical protein